MGKAYHMQQKKQAAEKSFCFIDKASMLIRWLVGAEYKLKNWNCSRGQKASDAALWQKPSMSSCRARFRPQTRKMHELQCQCCIGS